MGSAEGRAKCCFSFYSRGYEAVVNNYLTGSSAKEDATDDDLDFAARTVSNSFRSLFRLGYRQAWADKKMGVSRPPEEAYGDYRESKGRDRYFIDRWNKDRPEWLGPIVRLPVLSAEGQSQTGSERENDAEKEENDLQILPPLDSYEADVEVTEVRPGRAMPIEENDLGEKRPGG